MRPYSLDLRQRVVAAVDARVGTWKQIAKQFSVSESWIGKLIAQRRTTGSIAPRPHGGGAAPALDDTARARLADAVEANPDATLDELRQTARLSCSLSTVCRMLQRLGYVRKKSRCILRNRSERMWRSREPVGGSRRSAAAAVTWCSSTKRASAPT